MKIDVRESSGVVVVEPKGKVTIAGGDVALRQQVDQLLDQGHQRILVGLSDVTAMDSSGSDLPPAMVFTSFEARDGRA